MRLKLVPALVALACTPPALLAQVTDSMILNDARSVGDVLSWGLGTEGQRYSPLKQVNTATVSRLVPAWAFSFGGEAYFVIGMSPVSDRIARRFPWPLLVFNAHATLRALREAKMFERMKHVIRTRDSELEGEPNRHLFDHGVVSEASQYSGVTHKIEPSLFRFPPNTENVRAVN